MRSLPSDEARREVASGFLPITQATADKIWLKVVDAFKWVLWGATIALVAAVGVALFREVDQALIQILLTVFTTVAGIFAGFIGGKALGSSTGSGSTGG
jgi:choline-glycine betaine transporter